MDPRGHQQPPLSLGTPGRDLGAGNILVTARTLSSRSVFCSHGGGTDRPGREGGTHRQLRVWGTQQIATVTFQLLPACFWKGAVKLFFE